MYTGLVLLPWVIFFGFSGMLFNHPEWFGPVEVLSEYSREEVERIAVFEKPNANRIADEIVAKLSQSRSGEKLVRVSDDDAVVEGTLNFQCETTEGRAMVILSANTGEANVRRFLEAEKISGPDFDGRSLEIDSFQTEASTRAATSLIADAGLKTTSGVKPSERGGAEVRFQMASENSRERWNVSYDLFGGTITAKAADASSGMDAYSVLSRLHKTHHYPDRKGARWLWTLLADATGITMVFWGISGAAMWWQIKPTRLMGVAGLTIAALLAAFVFTGTFSDLTFVPRKSRGGPPRGERPTESISEKEKNTWLESTRKSGAIANPEISVDDSPSATPRPEA